ncbi:acetoin utilization AcuB family protein [Rummeliibacillus sp. POC4]|uniref:acetoin utilization AcuB family protein n=1 Tax=Rummeliibacillus sp. POC4 TaxID=2305899 RepID=UPI000E6620C3|nr:acetoin utilization AcuB family protein [Rummeliibacillus sp. POC4]RIJ66694.1 CBS domain-containing protein [Rummeliibacillus sp. POC4]
MLIEEIMKTKIFTLKSDNTIKDALRIMRANKIRHLPIVNDENNLVGLLTERDLKNALPSPLVKKTVENIYEQNLEKLMITNPIVCHPLDFVEETALIFYENRIGCLPVVSGGKLVGIVTTNDLLYTYIEITGATRPSSQIEIRVNDQAGTLHDVTKVFTKHHASILSVLVYPDSQHEEKRILSIRVKVMNPLPIIDDLRKEGFDVLWPNMPGINRL